MISQVAKKHIQACADHCATFEDCLFWTFKDKDKICTLRNSTPGRGGVYHHTSGNRECGLFPMRGGYETVSKLPLKAVTTGSQRTVDSRPPELCADDNRETYCTVAASPASWLALDLGKVTQVDLTAGPCPRAG